MRLFPSHFLCLHTDGNRRLPPIGVDIPNDSDVTFAELDWFAAYEKERSEREALHRLKEELNKKARREARIKKLKEEHGTTRCSAKRKVCINL